MRSETGFFHLNLANEWPKFDLLDPNVTIAPDGALTLARTTGDGFATRGVFRGGPFSAMDGPTPWYQVAGVCGFPARRDPCAAVHVDH